MQATKITPLAVALCAALALGSLRPLQAQSGAAPAEHANGVSLLKWALAVDNLEKSYEFYRALGLELQAGMKIGPSAVAPPVQNLTATPAGTQFRMTMLDIPGAKFPLELVEFTHLDRTTSGPRIQDPGASLLILTVRDVDAALAAAKKAGAEVVTLGGQPVSIAPNGTTRMVIVKDPNGSYVELSQPNPSPASDAPASSNILAASFCSVVEDAAQAARFYETQFGLNATVSEWNSAENSLKASGLSQGRLRAGSVTAPNAKHAWVFLEFDGVDRKPNRRVIPDPGVSAPGFVVRDLAAALKSVQAAGGSIVSREPIHTPAGVTYQFVRDPNGIFVELVHEAH